MTDNITTAQHARIDTPLLTSAEVAQLEHHIRDHEATCAYSCSLIRRLLDAAKAQEVVS